MVNSKYLIKQENYYRKHYILLKNSYLNFVESTRHFITELDNKSKIVNISKYLKQKKLAETLKDIYTQKYQEIIMYKNIYSNKEINTHYKGISTETTKYKHLYKSVLKRYIKHLKNISNIILCYDQKFNKEQDKLL